MKRCKVCNVRIWNPWHKGFDLLDFFYKTPNNIFNYTAKDVCWACGAVTYTEIEKLKYESKGEMDRIKELEDIMYYRISDKYGVIFSLVSVTIFNKLMASKKLIEPVLREKLTKRVVIK